MIVSVSSDRASMEQVDSTHRKLALPPSGIIELMFGEIKSVCKGLSSFAGWLQATRCGHLNNDPTRPLGLDSRNEHRRQWSLLGRCLSEFNCMWGEVCECVWRARKKEATERQTP